MKLCKNCAYCRPTGFWIFKGYEYARCAHTVEGVEGKPEYFCSTQRESPNLCSSTGKYWEPKK